jgi:hypothetical protein
MSEDEDEPPMLEGPALDMGSADGHDMMGFGPLMPTDSERSLMERVRQELKMELKQVHTIYIYIYTHTLYFEEKGKRNGSHNINSWKADQAEYIYNCAWIIRWLQGFKSRIEDVREEILRKRRAGKLPGDTTSILKQWWQQHSKWPYPTVSALYLSCSCMHARMQTSHLLLLPMH